MADSFNDTSHITDEEYKELDKEIDKKREAEESVGSVVGPMLPQPPYGGHGDIVDKIGAGHMNEEYTESIVSAAGDAIKNTASTLSDAAGMVKDSASGARDRVGRTVSTIRGKGKIDEIEDPYPNDSLPGNLRRLANENGFLIGKRLTLGRVSKTSERNNEKYRKRIEQIGKQYKRELNKEQDPAVKNQMAVDYLKRTNYYKKKASDMVRHRIITEEYNAGVEELMKIGALPQDSFLVTDEYYETPIMYPTMDELITEKANANRELHKASKECVKAFNKAISKLQKNLKKKQYDDALGNLMDATAARDGLEAELKKFEKEGHTKSIDDTYWAMVLNLFYIDYSAMVRSLTKLTFPQVIAKTDITYKALQEYDAYYKHVTANKKKGDLDQAYYNPIYRKSIDILAKIKVVLKEAEKAIKAEQAGAPKMEATEMFADEINLTYLYENGCMDTEDYLDEYITEARKPDDGMMDILKTLNKKGYKTRYSCSGHKNGGKHDRNGDGIVDGKLVSAARIQFKKDYNFPDPPKHWGWKSVEGADYLYVLPITAKKGMSDAEHHRAFDEWKNSYMSTLKTWVDALKPVSETKEIVQDNEKGDTAYDKEKNVLESFEYDDGIDAQAYLEEAFAMFSVDINY